MLTFCAVFSNFTFLRSPAIFAETPPAVATLPEPPVRAPIAICSNALSPRIPREVPACENWLAQ